MSTEPVTVATFATAAEAELAKHALESADILACLADAETVGTLSYLGAATGWVKLQVRGADVERARAVLASIDRARGARDADTAGWLCPNCGADVSGDFAVCWSCGATPDGQPDADFQREPVETTDEDSESVEPQAQELDEEPLDARPPIASDIQSENPYRSPEAPVESVVPQPTEQLIDTAVGDAVAARAFRAAVFGPFICPPLLTLYSVWLVLRIAFSDHGLSAAGARRFYAAMAINIAVWATALLFWRLVVS